MIPRLVVTSWSESGRKIYGESFLAGFRRYWPGIPLDIRTDESLLLADPEIEKFFARELDHETKNRDDIHKGVAKWAWKVFALTSIPLPEDGWVLWVDGDVAFAKSPDLRFFEQLCPRGKDVSFLDRPWAYASETGCVAYNCSELGVQKLLASMRNTYVSGAFRTLPEWGDAAVFDHCRKQLNLREHNLTPADATNELHVWPRSILGEFMTHNKGKSRKSAAYGGAV